MIKEKLFFALFGSLMGALWVASLALGRFAPQLLLIVCSLGVLRLSPTAAVGGACLAGFVWDLFDWQVRLGTHAGSLGIGCFLLSGLRSKLDITQPLSWPTLTFLLGAWATAGGWALAKLLGFREALPPGWWWQHLVIESLWCALIATALLPWRHLFQAKTPVGEAPVSLIPLFVE